MKQLISYVLAGVAGGAVTLGGFLLVKGNDTPPAQTAVSYAKPVHLVNTRPESGFSVPADFTNAAELATLAVVHISAQGSSASKGNKAPSDPWSRFFGEDFLLDNPFLQFNQPMQGTGSGVIYSADGYILTNNHVVEFADQVEVTTYDNKKYSASVVGTYPDGDLAVLKIDAKELPVLPLADSDKARIGEWVLAVGNPLELNSTVTAGIISAKGRDINIIRGKSPIESFIQTDAAVNPGNSGGALVDADGKLLGINTAIATKTGFFEGYSFAIPINLARRIADDIIENGSYQRGFLGINIMDLDSKQAEDLGLDISQGIYVESVIDGGAAQLAGIIPDDIIVGVNDKVVKSSPDLLEIVGGAKAGETVTLSINRRNKVLKIPVKLRPAAN
ncbi:MAG: hypothetical protein RLY31_2276 [Bacteroidota bacterium]